MKSFGAFLKNNYPIITGSLFVLLKLFLIDIDLPKLDVAYYHPTDEMFYASPAYNLFETGKIFVEDEPTVFGHPWVTNLLTYISLLVFGDNYLGLRFPSIFCGLISVLFFGKLLKLFISNSLIQLGFVLIMVFNFPFVLSNIAVEPTITRMAAALISLYFIYVWALKKKYTAQSILVLSTGITVLWLFTYPTNAFTVLALGIVILLNFLNLQALRRGHLKHIIRPGIFFLIGILIAVVIWSAFAYIMGDNPLDMSRGEHYTARVKLSFQGIRSNLISIAKANIFLFNPFFFFISMLALLYNMFFLALKSHKVQIVLIFTFSFLLQSLFINDYPQRKLILLLPFLLLHLAIAYENLFIRKQVKRFYESKKLVVVILSFLAIFCSVWLLGLIFISKHAMFHPLAWLGSTILLLYFLIQFLREKIHESFNWIPVCLIFLLFDSAHTVDYLVIHSSKHYKKASETLAEYDGEQFWGGLSMAFRAYNKIQPTVNPFLYYGRMDYYYQKIDSLSRNGALDRTIGYANDSIHWKKIGYEPVSVLIPAEKTVVTKDIVLYQENPKK